mgnify:CR=1 FL=1|tara:strand:- start:7236 stop:8159 length:924 start_codon:yes stop_codon:yes gene_type:complete
MDVFVWSILRICRMVQEMQKADFDCIIIIEGNRGLGKSTLAYKVASGVQEYHHFNPWQDILYTREDIIKAFNRRWKSNFIADEMINVSFNRDHYSDDQKKLIKIINMNRDHCNLFIACVPQFSALDSQIKNLCKIRITVLKRGLAILHTPNRTIYSPDKWDTAINEKIERSWMKSNIFKPKYSKLTTFRGMIQFNPLTEKQEDQYKKIKIEKRNKIMLEEEGKIELIHDFNDMVDTMIEQGKIKTIKEFIWYCQAHDKNYMNVRQNITNRMRQKKDMRQFKDRFPKETEVNQKGVGKKTNVPKIFQQ